jgi:hypothetical protein
MTLHVANLLRKEKTDSSGAQRVSKVALIIQFFQKSEDFKSDQTHNDLVSFFMTHFLPKKSTGRLRDLHVKTVCLWNLWF